jgi:hypothetical protein
MKNSLFYEEKVQEFLREFRRNVKIYIKVKNPKILQKNIYIFNFF